jgi:hypothetical protein
MNNQLGGVWGEYCVEVVKSGGASYYPFGEERLKNVILDQFFSRVLSGNPHGIETFVQTCITSTGNTPATRTDTGLNGIENDRTYASSGFFKQIVTGENRITMTRDFSFNTLTGQRTYREACVGMIDMTPTGIFSPNLITSHFVFPNDVSVNAGDSLKITYSLNLIIDYLATGKQITLTGDGYNFGGRIRLVGNPSGIFSIPTNTSLVPLIGTWATSTFAGGLDQDSFRWRSYQTNSSGYGTTNLVSNSDLNNQILGLFGTSINNDRRIGFFTGFYNSGYNNTYTYQQTGQGNGGITTPFGSMTTSNFQIADSGAQIDLNYYFAPSAAQRTCSGIFLNTFNNANTVRGNSQGSIVYLLFNTPQTIPAEQPMSMKLRWYFSRL